METKFTKQDRNTYRATIEGVEFTIERYTFHGVETGGWHLYEDGQVAKHFPKLKDAKAAARVGIAADEAARRQAESDLFWSHEAEAYSHEPGETVATVIADDSTSNGTIIAGYGFVPAGGDLDAAREEARRATALDAVLDELREIDYKDRNRFLDR